MYAIGISDSAIPGSTMSDIRPQPPTGNDLLIAARVSSYALPSAASV